MTNRKKNLAGLFMFVMSCALFLLAQQERVSGRRDVTSSIIQENQHCKTCVSITNPIPPFSVLRNICFLHQDSKNLRSAEIDCGLQISRSKRDYFSRISQSKALQAHFFS